MKTLIFCFLCGSNALDVDLFGGRLFFTACAITSQGKWIAGAVSMTPELAVDRVCVMAEKKAPHMLSTPFEVEKVLQGDSRLAAALERAFKSLP